MSYLAHTPPPLIPISTPIVIINNEESQSCFSEAASAPDLLLLPRVNSNNHDSLMDNNVNTLMGLVTGVAATLSRIEDRLKQKAMSDHSDATDKGKSMEAVSSSNETGVKTRSASRKATRKNVFVQLSNKKINQLVKESKSCVKFIGNLLLESFPKNYFIQHRFKDITPWQLNKLYGIVSTKFSEIRRANRASVPVTLKEVSAVVRHKTINFRSEAIAINNVFGP